MKGKIHFGVSALKNFIDGNGITACGVYRGFNRMRNSKPELTAQMNKVTCLNCRKFKFKFAGRMTTRAQWMQTARNY